MDADKIAKIRALAERGATEGERAAARAALDRIGSDREMDREDLLDEVFSRLFSDEEIYKIVTFNLNEQAPVRSARPSHHGRVWYDRY